MSLSERFFSFFLGPDASDSEENPSQPEETDLSDSGEEVSCPPVLNELGVTTTSLSVYGMVEVNGRVYEARSNHYTFVPEGVQVRVVGREGYAYVVAPV